MPVTSRLLKRLPIWQYSCGRLISSLPGQSWCSIQLWTYHRSQRLAPIPSLGGRPRNPPILHAPWVLISPPRTGRSIWGFSHHHLRRLVLSRLGRIRRHLHIFYAYLILVRVKYKMQKYRNLRKKLNLGKLGKW